MSTNRTDFHETWLTEMPQGIGSFPMYDYREYNIKDRIKSGSAVIDLGNGLKKIAGQQVVYACCQYSQYGYVNKSLTHLQMGFWYFLFSLHTCAS